MQKKNKAKCAPWLILRYWHMLRDLQPCHSSVC